MLTIIADANISHLNDYFAPDILGVKVNLISMAGREITAETIAKHQPNALLVRSVTPVNATLLDDSNSVTYVGSATIGTDHIDMTYLSSRGIYFANASGCSKHTVAQYVITAILNLQPSLATQNSRLGIVGLGNIGSTLAKYAQDLGWQVFGYDPLLPKSATNNCGSLEVLLRQSDVVSLHVPLTMPTASTCPTYHLIDEQALAMMKLDSLLINSARGQVIKESALLADLAQNRQHGRQVVLDVFEHEPIVSGDLLNQLDIATPHIAGYSLEGKLRGTHLVYEAFCQQFKLPIVQQPHTLLPANPLAWQTLLADMSNLKDFYDIMADDADLRERLDINTGQVSGVDFDKLRKNYPLRREWGY